MDTRLLKHFLAVYDSRHFGRAAEALGMSKQGLSKSISKLEDSIDASLFDRGRFGVLPTEFGEALASHARLIMAETRIAEEEIAGLKNAEGGEVRVGSTPSMSDYIVPKAISQFRARSPKVSIQVISRFPNELLEMLAKGELDVIAGALRPGMPLPDNIQRESLFALNDVVMCRPGHPVLNTSAALGAKPKLADLEGYPWIVPVGSSWVSDKVTSAFQAAGYAAPHDFVATDDISFIRSMMLHSDHLYYGSRGQFGWELDSGSLAAVFVPQLTDVREAALFSRRGGILTRACIGLIGEIRRVASDSSVSNVDTLTNAAAS